MSSCKGDEREDESLFRRSRSIGAATAHAMKLAA